MRIAHFITSCSLTEGIPTQPPRYSMLRDHERSLPSGAASTIGNPTSAKFRMLRQSYWQFPPERTGLHTFDDMGRRCATRPSCSSAVRLPTKLMNQRRQRSNPCPSLSAGNDDSRVAIQRFNHRPGAQVSIRALNSDHAPATTVRSYPCCATLRSLCSSAHRSAA